MWLLRVEVHQGATGSTEPTRVHPAEGPALAVLGVDDRWQDPGANYFRVRLADGSRTILRHDLDTDTWSVVLHQLLDA